MHPATAAAASLWIPALGAATPERATATSSAAQQPLRDRMPAQSTPAQRQVVATQRPRARPLAPSVGRVVTINEFATQLARLREAGSLGGNATDARGGGGIRADGVLYSSVSHVVAIVALAQQLESAEAPGRSKGGGGGDSCATPGRSDPDSSSARAPKPASTSTPTAALPGKHQGYLDIVGDHVVETDVDRVRL